jgi:hypothetical protein
MLSSSMRVGSVRESGVSMQNLADTPTPERVTDTNVRLGVGMVRKPSGGRPHKGDRALIATRLAQPLATVVRARADEASMTITDYVAMVLARAHGMPEYAPVPSTSMEQGVLPLSKTA